jgi:soluble lytic murein transglycosylase-like protein
MTAAKLLARHAVLVLVAVCAFNAYAGAQHEEVLADSVRTALSAAIAQTAPPEPIHANAQTQQQYEKWLTLADARLEKRLNPRDRVGAQASHELDSANLRREFLQTVWYESQRAGLEPSLVLGLIEVESGFRKFAISSVGARGFMQVMPFWTRQLAQGDASVLFQMQTNLRFGCVILRHYLDLEKGNLTLALGRYNGSRGSAVYPNAVLGKQRGWQVL